MFGFQEIQTSLFRKPLLTSTKASIRTLILESLLDKKKASQQDWLNVTRQGFEPRQTVPKTVVLPLHHRAN